ncbi:hypothetical protein EDB92DRAFT_1824251 [Lactarius akahatsu]|uniref:RING-type E3 ubiquitin transferase n=1 Tax=Lactarius akahatsu TaxID=416441 RepID=A0AAD4LQ12_9AGAM|nr:hypothetical protein EDB92DRAFT_1824251 [Lactarius akahatsu]
MADISVQTQSRKATSPNRGRRRPRGRGPSRGGRGGAKTMGDSTTNPDAQAMDGVNLKVDADTAAAADVTASQTEAQEDDNQDLCWICAEPVKYYAVSECNHRTCHICALRLRALYKKLDCTFCKEPQPTVIFTVSPDAPFASYAPDAIQFQDVKLAISFETQEIMEESLLLLRFNCPDSSCDYIATGWNDLKLHARGNHSKLMCDLCIRHKKVFPHEHALYTSPQLFTHLPSMQRRQQKSAPKDQVEGGVHPLCEFCRECLFGDDELYTHMRHTHEECFICKRNEIRDKYFQNYEALEQHFEQAHHLCPNPTCQASKFVVFGSRIDLQAHMVEEHGAEMSTRDKKDARRVDAAFEFQDASSGSNRRRGGGPTGSGGGREREQRDPQPQLAPRPISGLESRRNRFGAHLTTEGDANDLSPGPSRHQTPSPPPPSMDPITGERYTAIFVRLRNLAPHPINAIAGVKLALRDYTASQSGARDLISTIWNILDRDLDATASIVNLIVDFLEDEEKKTALLSAWNGFKVERRREFPDLMPTSVGTDYAGITDGRTLNAATARRAAGPRQAQRAVWDRVAQAAERGASFPALRTPRVRQPQAVAPPRAQHTATGPTPNFRKQSARNTAWSASAAGVSGGGGGNSNNGNGASVSSQGGRPPAAPPPPAPPLTDSAFPTLPGSAAPRARPIVSARTGQLQHILGSAPPTTSAWAPGRTAQDEAGGREGEEVAVAAEASPAPGGKKKGKQKQKQMLFMLGSTGRQE